jgi:hypothetical protein
MGEAPFDLGEEEMQIKTDGDSIGTAPFSHLSERTEN